MKINFTAFNHGQEHFIFDDNVLEKDEVLEKFLINKDESGKIYIVPMIKKGKYTYYPLEVLDKV